MPVLQRHHLRHLPYGTIVRVQGKQPYRFARIHPNWWAHTMNPKLGVTMAVMENLADMGRVDIPDLPDHLLPVALRVTALDRPVPVEWDAYSGTYSKAPEPKGGDKK